MSELLVVALGPRRYRVERPWGDGPSTGGKVTDVAVDARGHVLVLRRSDPLCDPPRDCVDELDAHGRLLGSFGAGTIADAHMIECGPDGRVWVVDRDAHAIVAFDGARRPVGALGHRHRPLEPFNHPSDLAVGPRGDTFVADGYGAGLVHRFSAAGERLLSWGGVGVAPGLFLTAHGIAVLRDGRVAVADRENDRVQVFQADGALDAVWTGFHRPSSLWVDAEGLIYVSDAIPTLNCLAPDGALIGRCRPVLNGAHGICGDEAGRLYLAEGNPSRVTRLAPLDG